MQGFQQRTAGSSAVCQLELKIDAITFRGDDWLREQASRASIIYVP